MDQIVSKKKFIFGLKKRKSPEQGIVYWICGAVVIGIDANFKCVKGKYSVYIRNLSKTIFMGKKYTNVYFSNEKFPHSFLYYWITGNTLSLLYWMLNFILLPLGFLWYSIMGIYSTPDREYWNWWTSAIIWLSLGLLGIYYLIFEFKL